MNLKKLILLSGILFTSLITRADEAKLYIADWKGTVTTVSYDDTGLKCFYWFLNDGAESLNYLTIVSSYYMEEWNLEYDEQNRPIFPEGTVKLEMPLRDMKAISLSEITDNVESVNATNIGINVNRGTVSLSGITNPTDVSVYTLDGIRAFNKRVATDITIDLTTFSSGVFVVNVDNKTFKIFVP